MVTLDQLEALDLIYWTRSGVFASKLAYCDESSLSRRANQTLKIFGLALDRSNFQICGDESLLNLQRAVHQHARCRGDRPIRLDATHLIRHVLVNPDVPAGTILGPCDHVGFGRIVQLIKSRVLDAWITSDLFDLPDDDELEVLHLWHWPPLLAVHASHPLAGRSNLTAEILSGFPSLILPHNLYPKLSEALHSLGFGKKTQMRRYDKGSWSLPSADAMTIVYGSCLSLEYDTDLVALDWDLGLTGGEALVFRRDISKYPWLSSLLDDLKARQNELIKRHPSLVPLL